ncbi:MAG: flagellar filament capping protein FliD [Magnetococcales bacterium]|nr:flagellar filament capping protein FliD [Magnetococcales bacterium]
MAVGSTTANTSTSASSSSALAQSLLASLSSASSNTSSSSSSSSSGSSGTGGISFGGLATGLPSNIVDMLMSAQQGQMKSLQTNLSNLTNEQSIYASLNSKLAALDTQITALKDPNAWAPHTVSSSSPSLATATAASGAMSGNHTLNVAQLATNDTWVLGDASMSSGSGMTSVTDTLGPNSTLSFTYNGAQYDTGDLSGKTLTDVASTINGMHFGSNPGVSANIMYDGSAYRLVLSAKDSGQYNGDPTNDPSGNRIYGTAATFMQADGTTPYLTTQGTGTAATSTTTDPTSGGTFAAGSTFSFTYNGTVYTTPDLSGQSLTAVANTINGMSFGSDPGVTVTVQGDGSLLLTAKDTGQYTGTNAASDGSGTRIYGADFLDASGTSFGATTQTQAGVDAATVPLTTFTNTMPAQNAIFQLDGVNMTNTSNTPSNVLTGITLQLIGTTGAKVSANGKAMGSTANSTPVVISVADDSASIKTQLNSFATAYNAVIDFVAQNKTALDSSSMARNIETQLQNALHVRTSAVGATSPNSFQTFSTLAEYGLRTDPYTGDISFDSTSLDKALQNGYSNLAAMFTSTQSSVGTGNNPGLAYRLQTLLDGITNSATGSLTTLGQSLQSQIGNVNKEIAQESTRLDAVRQQLNTKYSNLEQMVSKLNSAGSAMTSALSKM